MAVTVTDRCEALVPLLSCQDELGLHTENKNVHRRQIGKGQGQTKQTNKPRKKVQGRCIIQEQGGNGAKEGLDRGWVEREEV